MTQADITAVKEYLKESDIIIKETRLGPPAYSLMSEIVEVAKLLQAEALSRKVKKALETMKEKKIKKLQE